MIRLLLALLIALCFCPPAGAIQAPVYIDELQNYSTGPAPEYAWPDIEVAQDEIDYWNNHKYFPFIAENDLAVYLVKSYMKYAGLSGGGVWIASADSFADKTSMEYTFDGKQTQSEGRLRRLMVHEFSHAIAGGGRFNEAERRSFFALIGYETDAPFSLDSSHQICLSFRELWGSYKANGWEGSPPPPGAKPWYEYRLYYAFYDCMINDHAEFIDYSTVPNRTRGDVDDNGKIDCTDLDLISELKGSNAYYNDFGRFWSADYNGDNVVDSKDVELVAQKVGSCRVYVNRPQPDREQVRKKCEDVRRNIKERLGNYNRIRLN